MLQALQYKAKVLERIADGDLTVDIEKASEADGLGQSLLEMKQSLTDIMSQIMTAADQVTTGSDQVSQASQDLSQGATEQASSLEEISSSINEINSQSKQNAENATEANALAKQSAGSAESGNAEMKNLTTAMAAINASSDEIKKAVKVIDDIAFQINLPALNANVEAARAGKYGKGFAVVAEEVRNLAVKSADAVKKTTLMVDESIKNIERGNSSVESTAKQLEAIVTGVSKVASFLDEIAAASKEQAQGIEADNRGTGPDRAGDPVEHGEYGRECVGLRGACLAGAGTAGAHLAVQAGEGREPTPDGPDGIPHPERIRRTKGEILRRPRDRDKAGGPGGGHRAGRRGF